MTFENLEEQPDCNCLNGAVENFTSQFAIKTNRPSLVPNDFKTKWEKGEQNVHTCKERCGKKGKSMSMISEDGGNLEDLLSVYRKLFPLSPGYKPHFTIITLGEDSGVIKHTPREMNIHHHDFYKCDNFQMTSINYVNSIPLANNV